ncbi:MAG: hypothetical protein PHY45_00785 [Rhodocyclaceae bacterium]|nr:hypothetical protein [Rhodocyclaceae bacterium]
MPRLIRRRLRRWFGLAMLLSATATWGGFGMGIAAAADTPQPANPDANPAAAAPPASERTAPAEIVKPVLPSKAELADSAFKKLDATGKGYVTLADVSGLGGFDKAFEAADPAHTGKLNLAQFKKAWAMYSGYQQ